MIFKTIIRFVLALSLSVSGALAGPKKAAFDGKAALSYTQVLASDAMEGRMSGEPGGEAAADYIARKLAEWGVPAGGPGGSYFQDMTYEYCRPERGAALDIFAFGKRRAFVVDEDWRSQTYSGSGHFSAPVVFAGYGISAPEKGYDDYAGIDVKDKLVLFSTDSPRKPELVDALKEAAGFQNRIKAAQAHGARGVVTFRPETPGSSSFFGSRGGGLKKEIYKQDFVILSAENRVVEFMFKHEKTEARYLYQQIDLTGKPQSYEMGVRSFVNLTVNYDPKRQTRNVLARIPGADRMLSNETVVLGAHMDHLGIDMSGDVFNGADDNASGTAVVMEIARVMKANGFKPRRTIVFALWAAEEEGLLGSKFYTENPVYPLEKTVACLNLDMEGHGDGKVGFRGIYYAPEMWEFLKARLPKEMIDNVIAGRGGPGGSDHTYFLYQGVPAFFVQSAGSHFKTNRVGDVSELIKPEVLEKVGIFVEAAAAALASDPKASILPARRERYYWRYETVVNHETPSLEHVIGGHKDVVDPDVDFQLAVIPAKEGLSGDALAVQVMRDLMDGLDKVRETKGLVPYGPRPSGIMAMFNRPAPKTTVLTGLHGVAAFKDDLRWADVLSKQGLAFVSLEGPGALFSGDALSEDGKKIVEALGKADILIIPEGLGASQAKSLLEASKKPVVLRMKDVPSKEIADLVKKTGSTIGLVLGKSDGAAAYFKKLDDAKKALGADSVAVVAENCLWGAAGQTQMLDVIGEMLKAKYENADLEKLLSGAFMRVLDGIRAPEPPRPAPFIFF